jgi:hypothetical protein
MRHARWFSPLVVALLGMAALVDAGNAVAQSFSAAAPMITARGSHTATLLPNGQVWVAGVQLRSMLLDQDETTLFGYATVEEEHPTHDRSGSHAYLEEHCAP